MRNKYAFTYVYKLHTSCLYCIYSIVLLPSQKIFSLVWEKKTLILVWEICNCKLQAKYLFVSFPFLFSLYVNPFCYGGYLLHVLLFSHLPTPSPRITSYTIVTRAGRRKRATTFSFPFSLWYSVPFLTTYYHPKKIFIMLQLYSF